MKALHVSVLSSIFAARAALGAASAMQDPTGGDPHPLAAQVVLPGGTQADAVRHLGQGHPRRAGIQGQRDPFRRLPGRARRPGKADQPLRLAGGEEKVACAVQAEGLPAVSCL